MMQILEDAPNPQHARRNWVDLNGTWSFRYDDDNVGLKESWSSGAFDDAPDIVVPFPPESTMSGIGDYGFHPVVWYQRELPEPHPDAQDRTLIHFGAVDYEATVWINGSLVGSHIGGSTPFTIDVPTEWLRSLDHPLLTLRVFDDPVDLEQPRGKQSWTPEPEIIFYKRTTGIWQPVWMESAPSAHITHFRFVWDSNSHALRFELELNQPPAETETLELTMEDAHGAQHRAMVTTDGRFARGELEVSPEGNLWSPENPLLLPITLTTSGGDELFTYAGLREVSIDREGLRINEHPYWMRFVLSQGYFADSHLASPSTDAARKEVEVTLALGFNGARLHQKAEDPRYLYWADKCGLLLWGEIGAAYTWSDRAIDLHAREWREVVRRDLNHPSIVAWVPFNESWGVGDIGTQPTQQDAIRSIYYATRALDQTRPVIGNDGWEHVTTDILSLHDYNWSGETLTERYATGRSNEEIAETYYEANKKAIAAQDGPVNHLPIMVTEYGGVSFAPSEGDAWFGYGKVSNAHEFAEKYRELTTALQASDELIGVCYTQLTDTEQEINGLLREDRTPKIDMEILSSITKGTRTS